MTEMIRVTPDEAYGRVKSGKAVFVCAYNDDERYKTMTLEGSIPLSEFDARISEYPKDQEIIFYCA